MTPASSSARQKHLAAIRIRTVLRLGRQLRNAGVVERGGVDGGEVDVELLDDGRVEAVEVQVQDVRVIETWRRIESDRITAPFWGSSTRPPW